MARRGDRASESPESRDLAIAYCLAEFPSVSETFIQREMEALERRGLRIVPLALRPPRTWVRHARAAAWEQRTTYRPPSLLSVGTLKAFLVTALRRPAGMASAVWLVLARSLRRPALLPELCGALVAAAAFAPSVDREQVRHIHSHFASVTATAAYLLAEISGLPVSLSCHARDIWTTEAALMAEKLQESEFVTVCTQAGYERLVAAYPLAAGPKLHLVRHGLDLQEFHPVHRQPAALPMVLSVGRLVEKKGFDVLLRAAAELAARALTFHLAIVGDGPQRERLSALAAELGIANVVTFHGELPMDEVRMLYARAAVFVLASVIASDGDRDGLPNVLLEAGAMGLPIVAAATSAIPEFVVDEETGLLAEPHNAGHLADQIERVLRDTELGMRLGAAARAAVATTYDGDRNAEALEALFRQVVETGRTRRDMRRGRANARRH